MKHKIWIVILAIFILLNISLFATALQCTPTPNTTPSSTGIGGILAGIIIVLLLILVAAVWLIVIKYKSTK